MAVSNASDGLSELIYSSQSDGLTEPLKMMARPQLSAFHHDHVLLCGSVRCKSMNLVEILQEECQALAVSELAILLRVSQRQLYKLAAVNRIPSFKIGASVRFEPAAVAGIAAPKNVSHVRSSATPYRHRCPTRVLPKASSS